MISEILHISRNKVSDIILAERVFVNFKNETKMSKELNIGDIITVRGKGRFKLINVQGNTKKGRLKVVTEKYT